jgi:hypothetical protein
MPQRIKLHNRTSKTRGKKIKQNSPILTSSSKFHSKNLNVKNPDQASLLVRR